MHNLSLLTRKSRNFKNGNSPSFQLMPKENIGNYSNKGSEWNPRGKPTKTKTYDLEVQELGKGIPYGVDDQTRHDGWVSVGIDNDTAYFAIASIKRWCGGR